MHRSFVLACFVALWSLVTAHNQLLYPYQKECFFEDMKKGDNFAVSFQVGNRDPNSKDLLEVDFWINDPNRNPIYSLSRVADGDASIDIAVTGRYEYCFSNEFSSVGTKDVTFHIHGVVYIDSEDVAPNSLDAEVRTLARLVQDIKNEQGYIVIRERTHRNTAESTNSRVKWWSIFQLLVVAVNSMFQIYYLKRFFEVKTTV
ncbi:endosomal protein P24B [Trichomonascus vanleenenianus]|uniref:Emp24p n=1 Tax=Trichomonascus vanleenenianus TaxID=2268995 RepID=UPI003EC965FB